MPAPERFYVYARKAEVTFPADTPPPVVIQLDDHYFVRRADGHYYEETGTRLAVMLAPPEIAPRGRKRGQGKGGDDAVR